MKRTYYTTCPDCGAHLDPCERCDCRKWEASGTMKIPDKTPLEDICKKESSDDRVVVCKA